MTNLINKYSYLNVDGWSQRKIQEAANIFFESVDECAYIGDINLQERYHYLCFVNEGEELMVFVGDHSIPRREGAVELTEEDVFGIVSDKEFVWDGKGDHPPVNSICQTHFGQKVKVIAYTKVNHLTAAVLQDFDHRTEIDWVTIDLLEPLSDKTIQIKAIATELLNSVNLKGEDFAHLEMEVAEYLYNSGVRINKENINE